ncbi:hypothetical protein [Levilactobacillus lindianensis]|uniref:hypothetical protein n=1 Tax=Levilactobacillus lindianensis TaxID=2486018 RepID=UPI000F7461A6|nr:hypothetical protein [Levilactobacillus lindianensis]
MSKFKLSFNKESATDIASVVFILASGIVMFGNALGLTVPIGLSNSMSSWVSLVTQILGWGGLMRNTSKGNNQSQQLNVSSGNASKVPEKGDEVSEDAK